MPELLMSRLQSRTDAGLPNIDYIEVIGGGGVNTPPILTPITNQTIGVGVTLNITNTATDSDVPAQALTFSLLTAPTNAVINTNSGVLTWRPLVTQANTTNPFTVRVADSGLPDMGATQGFVVTVHPLVQPHNLDRSHGAAANWHCKSTVPADRIIKFNPRVNLVNWSAVLTTNSPAMPFVWTPGITDGPPMDFYRILAGPPF